MHNAIAYNSDKRGKRGVGHRKWILMPRGDASMAGKDVKKSWVMVNRASVLTLWAAVVAEVFWFEHDEALTLGRAVAGLNASSKGVPWCSSSRPPWGEGDGEGNVVQFEEAKIKEWLVLAERFINDLDQVIKKELNPPL